MGRLLAGALIALLGAAACADAPGRTAPGGGAPLDVQGGAKSAPKPLPKGLDPEADADPFPSTYRPLPGRPTAIVGATILTATGLKLEGATIVMRDGKIIAVGPDVVVPTGALVVDGRGKWVTPGLIDAHSHLGVYSTPSVPARSDGNELTDPNTAFVWAEHSIWPEDPGFDRARAGGVTTLQILPGSGNLFGGRSAVIKNIPSVTVAGMKFPGAPYGVKMACGENPKRVYGSKGRTPSTAMGNVAGYRRAWIDAADYARRWDDYRAKIQRGDKADPPKRDLTLDTLSGVLRGEISVQNHCYRADEMATMIDISHEFGFHIAMFHHASEAYKIAPLLAKEGICIATWADWAGFKMESLDGAEANAALAYKGGVCVVIHSDDPIITQHLNQEAAIAMAAGNRLGFGIEEKDAIAWITANPAKAIGVSKSTGTLEPGKMADVVVWDKDPFSIYARAQVVYVDGAVTFDRQDPRRQPRSDFELGQPGEGAFQ
jgi:imidazolonepropionase-like amidohydrolase